MVIEKEPTKEIRNEMGKNLSETERGLFSKFKEKAGDIGRIFMLATLFTIGTEALASEVKPEKDIRLISTMETMGNLMKSGVAIEKTDDGFNDFVFSKQYVPDPEGIIGSYVKQEIASVDGITTDSIKITEKNPQKFEIIAYNSDGSEDHIFTAEGKADSLTTTKNGKTLQSLSSEDLENQVRQQLKALHQGH